MPGKDLLHLCPFSCLIYCSIGFECHVYLHSFVFDFCVVLQLVFLFFWEHCIQPLVFVYEASLCKAANSTEWRKCESRRKCYLTCRSPKWKTLSEHPYPNASSWLSQCLMESKLWSFCFGRHKCTLCRRSEVGEKQKRHTEELPKPSDVEGWRLGYFGLHRVFTSTSPDVILPGRDQPLSALVV